MTAPATPHEDEALADVGDLDVYVHLPGPLASALVHRAHQEGRTMAAVVRDGLSRYLDQAPQS